MFVQRLVRLDKLSEPRVQSVVKLQLEVSPFFIVASVQGNGVPLWYVLALERMVLVTLDLFFVARVEVYLLRRPIICTFFSEAIVPLVRTTGSKYLILRKPKSFVPKSMDAVLKG